MKIDGTLRKLTGQWWIVVQGRAPVPIIAGEIFMMEVPGMADQRVRMEQRDGKWRAVLSGDGPEHPVELIESLRAGFFEGREWYAKIHP